MGLESKAGFVGLVTATGEVTAGGGALRIADNVSLRKEGALVLRSHFGSTALSRQYAAAFPYRGGLWYMSAANVVYTPSQTAALTLATTSPSAVRADVQSAKEARGNLYFATSEGAFKVQTALDTALYLSGLPPTYASLGYLTVSSPGTGTDLLAAGQQVAYRVVAVVTDLNGVVIRSRPSGAVAVQATGGGSPYVIMAADVDFIPRTARKVELYRTRVFPTSVSVDDEFQLVATFDLPASSSWSTTYIDQVPDTRRGTTLYTSPSRGGAENANDRPPGAACLERYRGSMFYGNTVGPQRVTFSYRTTATNLVGVAAGVGVRQTTGTTTAGGTTITSVANTTGLQVGMRAATFTSGTLNGHITSIVGSTVTMSAPIASAQTAQNVWFQDALMVDGVAAILGIGANQGIAGSGQYVSTSAALYSSTLRGTYTAYELTPPVAGYDQTVVFERIARGGAPFQVKATHGTEMSPALPLSSGAPTLASTNDVIPNGLAWSEPDEPEHVPPKNFARVGDAGKAILALVATKDRLLVFKEDGLFMLTGNTARDFGIYPLDTTALCILPGSVRRLQNTVYALTNLGLIAVDEGGSVNIVGRPVQNELAPIITAIRVAAKSNGGLYYMPGLTGVTGTADDPNGEYWMMLGTTSPSFGGQMLVYNAFRQGFTTYSFGTPTPGAVAQDGEGQPLVLTASTLLTPSTSLGAITARISPRAFSDPALVGKLWTHVVAGFSRLTGTTSITARFSSSESMVDGTTIDEVLEAPTSAGLVQLPAGSLMRHPVPRAMARAFLSFVELVVAVSNGTFTLELMGMEARENIPNKRPTHGTGST